MDGTQRHLKKRWDNAEHFPSLSGFPDHVHVGNEENVVPSKPIRILELIDIIKQELFRWSVFGIWYDFHIQAMKEDVDMTRKKKVKEQD